MRTRLLCAGLALVAALAGCWRSTDANDATGTRIVPAVTGRSSIPGQDDASDGNKVLEEISVPKIGLRQGERPLQTAMANLDLDPEEEQILALQIPGDDGSTISIVVADYVADKRSYLRTWEAITGATNPRVFSLYLIDMVGDHSTEIVGSGMNAAGKLTLDVYRKNAATAVGGLQYVPICQIAADELTIEEAERPDSYRLAQKNGSSYPIVAHQRDSESANPLDLVRVTYTWSYQDSRYMPTALERVPGEKVAQKQLERLYESSSPEPFEAFLTGLWYQTADAQGTAKKKIGSAMILFSVQDRRIVFSTPDIQEAYLWRESLRTVYNGLLIIAENEFVAPIKKSIFLRVTGLDNIEVSTQGTDLWDTANGRYGRMSPEVRRKLAVDVEPAAAAAAFELAGSFRTTNGTELIFQPPFLTLSEAGRQLEGYYAVFPLAGQNILSMTFPKGSNGGQERTYLIATEERKVDRQLFHILTLTPVRLSVRGFEELSTDPLVLEQPAAAKK